MASSILEIVAHVLGPVHPVRAALWLAAALGLAILLVYASERLSATRR